MPIGADLLRANTSVRLLLTNEGYLSVDAGRFWNVLLADDPLVRTWSAQLFARAGWQHPVVVQRLLSLSLPNTTTCRINLLLVYAAALFDCEDDRVSTVGYRLGFRHSHSFGRQVRRFTGMSPMQFRAEVPLPVALTRFHEVIVAPHRTGWASFRYRGARARMGAAAMPEIVSTLCAHCGASTRTVTT